VFKITSEDFGKYAVDEAQCSEVPRVATWRGFLRLVGGFKGSLYFHKIDDEGLSLYVSRKICD
jgi:hypothetical protein